MAERRTSTRYDRPHRPLPVRGVNAALAVASRFGAKPKLDPVSLMSAAEEATGLLDFGDPSFREPLARLVESIEREAGLHALGRLITRTRLVSTLANRARLEEYVRRNPEVERMGVMRPIVIAGLQRTGTTLLHRMLASDRRLRSVASWEALAPVPLDLDARPGDDGRRMHAMQSEKALAYLAPDFFAIHPVEADAPEEDVLLLDLSFRSTVAEATLRVPSFSRWLEEQDQLPAYRTLERALRVLAHQRSPMMDGKPVRDARWVLKTPHHLEWLDALFAVFPDALVVWTHREPRETLPSFCSMIAHGRGVFSDRVDPREVGRDWGRKVARMVERGMAARDAAGERKFIDVRYEDLVRDPLGQARRIYEAAELPFERETGDAMRDLLKKQRKDRFGHHVYRAEDFGLSAGGIDETFSAYRKRFLDAK
jgi:hypothetical protein